MKFLGSPSVLGRTIVLAGIVPAIGVGTIWGHVLRPTSVDTSPTPAVTQDIGDGVVVIPTPAKIVITPTVKAPSTTRKTPHVRGGQTNGPGAKVRVAATADDPSTEPTPAATKTYTAPTTTGPGHDEQGDPTSRPQSTPSQTSGGAGRVAGTSTPTNG